MLTSPTKIVFLIDEQSLMKGQIDLDQLDKTIMRILLFYSYSQQHQQQQQIQWSYRFFSTQTRYTNDSIRHFYTMTINSFQHVRNEYEKRDKERPKTQAVINAPVMRIKQVLKDVIGDFQWENTDLDNIAAQPPKNHVFLLTECPASLKDMILFFVSPHEEESTPEAASALSSCPASYPPYFQQTKEDLGNTLLKSYTQRRIVISMIDTDFKTEGSDSNSNLIHRIIRQGFESCFEQFGGHYILFHMINLKYDLYGHSFISELANYLPIPTTNRSSPPLLLLAKTTTNRKIPAWRGPFTTKKGKLIGNFELYPMLAQGHYIPTTLAFISEIRTTHVIPMKDFACAWLLKNHPSEPDVDYKFTCEQNEPPQLFNTILETLHHSQSVLIADLVPMADCYSSMARKVVIEPFSRCCASFRLLNENSRSCFLSNDMYSTMPQSTMEKCHVVAETELESPIGTFVQGVKFDEPLYYEESQSNCLLKVDMKAPAFIRAGYKKEKMNKGKKPLRFMSDSSVMQAKTESQQPQLDLEEIIAPTDINRLGKEVKKLYLKILYTQEATIENALVIIDKWITNLAQDDYTKQETAQTLFNHTMLLSDLEEKHRNEILKGNQRLGAQPTLEQAHLYEWWQTVKLQSAAARDGSEYNFEKMSCILLKAKEARLQVLLYCFIARLIAPLPENVLKRDPSEMAMQFYRKIVLTYSLHDIPEFVQEIDSEDGVGASKRRDQTDLNDFTFMQILEKRFSDLPELTLKFRENTGMDEMSSSDSSQSSMEDNYQEETFQPEPVKLRDTSKVRPTLQHTSSSSERNISSNSLPSSRYKTLPISRTNSISMLSKLQPPKIQRSNSNSIDSLMKKQVNVTASSSNNATSSSSQKSRGGEGNEATMAKVNRSKVNGLPTMKRAGSFTKSIQPPKRAKKAASMLSQPDTGTVILRRGTTLPDPETTPRTSMNRFLNTNLYEDYAEPCISPSNAANRQRKDEFVPSEIPGIIKTPTTTPMRYKKIMMGSHTPHRHEDENGFSVPSEEKHTTGIPPYTPRTQARRERDRIDRLQAANVPRNLTKRFETMRQENSQAQDHDIQQVEQIKKQNFHSLFEDDEEEIVEENPFLSSGHSRSAVVNNSNRFLSSQPSTPVVANQGESTEGEDVLGNGNNETDVGVLPSLTRRYGQLNRGYMDMDGSSEEEEESDDDMDLPHINGGRSGNRRTLF